VVLALFQLILVYKFGSAKMRQLVHVHEQQQISIEIGRNLKNSPIILPNHSILFHLKSYITL
jgi:hypothetical protein